MKIKDSIVVIGGGSQGVGFGIAKILAQDAKIVILLARRQENLNKAVSEIEQSGGKATGISVDLSDLNATKQVAHRIQQEFGSPQIVVCSSATGRFLSMEETSCEEAVEMMSNTYFASFFLIRFFLDDLLQKNEGHIVIVGSPARFINCSFVAYTASRHALYGLYSSMKQDLRNTKIRLTYVEPLRIRESTYIHNNPGTHARLPYAFRFSEKTFFEFISLQ